MSDDVRMFTAILIACTASAMVGMAHPNLHWGAFMISVLVILIIDRARVVR
jgi:hypothetical protein